MSSQVRGLGADRPIPALAPATDRNVVFGRQRHCAERTSDAERVAHLLLVAACWRQPQRSKSLRDLQRHSNPQVHIDCSEHADVSEFRHRILMQRPASPFMISNAVRGTWLGAGTPPSGGPDRFGAFFGWRVCRDRAAPNGQIWAGWLPGVYPRTGSWRGRIHPRGSRYPGRDPHFGGTGGVEGWAPGAGAPGAHDMLDPECGLQ